MSLSSTPAVFCACQMLQVISKQLGFLNHILPQLSFSMIFKAISYDFPPDPVHMFIVKKIGK